MLLPSGLKSTPLPVLPGNVEGFEYLVPKPELKGYTLIYGELPCAIAISLPSGLRAIALPDEEGKVDGLEYLLPKPEDDQEYTNINGLPMHAIAM